VQRATLKDVACRAGVHVATASRALNETSRHMVRAETLERVLGAAQDLGYSLNLTARTLRTDSSRAVGMLIPDLTNPIFPPMVCGAEEVLRDLGYTTWVVNTDDDSRRKEEAVSALRQRNVDGFIMATARLTDPVIDEMQGQRPRTPFVLVLRRAARSDIPSVSIDEGKGVRLALRHLIELGHRRIAIVAGPQDVSTGLATKQAFMTGVEEYGLPPVPGQVTVCGAFTFEAGRDAMRGRLRDGAPFTAVVAGNDLIALGCIDALAEVGLHCPRDMSVVGFNDMLLMDRVTPALTTVAIPLHDVGAEAARLLMEAIGGTARCESSVVLAPTLVARESTTSPAAGNGHVEPGRG